jgi:type I restriction enzyme, S subunit
MTSETFTTPGHTMVRSEIGSFPSNWPIRRLDQIAGGVSVGLVINPSTYFSEQGTIPMLLGSQVTPNKIDHESARRITPQGNEKIPASMLRAGDLVTVRVGDPGTTAVVTDDLDGCNCASMMIIRRNPAFNSTWLSHLLNSPIGRGQVANVQYGTAQKQFNIGDAVGFLFPVPPKTEQDALATALTDADALIDSLEQLLTKKRQIKQGAMQELLTGKRRLPGHTGEWSERALADVAICLDNLRHPLNEAQRATMQGDFPYCGANGVLDHINRFCIDDTVILIAEDGGYFDEYLTRPIAYQMSGKFWVNNHAHVLKAKEGFDQEFLFYSLVHKNILSFLASGTRAKLNRSELNKIMVRAPERLEEQSVIAAALSHMDAEITTLEARLAKARALKQAMAQALLTGRIRLVEPST